MDFLLIKYTKEVEEEEEELATVGMSRRETE